MIEDLIRRARRRFLLNETLAQFAFAAAVFIAGLVLVLLLGTRYLEWWTLTVFAVAGLGIGAYRVHRATPGDYTTAVRLDENAHLHDALSTALYFSAHTPPGVSEAFRGRQREQAESAAGTVQLSEAVPFAMPRALYAVAALCLLASGLIALRYVYGHGLDLRPPITSVLFEDQAVHDAKKTQTPYPKSQKQWMQDAQSLLSKLGMQQNPEQPAPGDADALTKAIEQALENPAENSGTAEKSQGSDKGAQAKSGESAKDQASNGDPIDSGDQQQQASDQQNGQEGANSKAGDSNAKPGSDKSGNSNSHQSLLSRLKDAMSNLLSKSNDQDSKASPQQNLEPTKSEAQNGQKGQPGGKGQQQKSDSQSSAQDGQADSDSQSAQQAQGRLNSPANATKAEGGSGIGSQNGSKEVKEAAQLKAMGKISEIIGQRAATVSGDTTVEVESGSQKLHTNYSNVTASHGETDSDVTRDEIPLALQSYVQQYFAEVRKSAEPAKGKAAPKQ